MRVENWSQIMRWFWIRSLPFTKGSFFLYRILQRQMEGIYIRRWTESKNKLKINALAVHFAQGHQARKHHVQSNFRQIRFHRFWNQRIQKRTPRPTFLHRFWRNLRLLHVRNEETVQKPVSWMGRFVLQWYIRAWLIDQNNGKYKYKKG